MRGATRPAAATRATAAGAWVSRRHRCWRACNPGAWLILCPAGNGAWEPWARVECWHERGGDDASDSLREDAASRLEDEVEDEDEDAKRDGYGGAQPGSRRWRLSAAVLGARARVAVAGLLAAVPTCVPTWPRRQLAGAPTV